MTLEDGSGRADATSYGSALEADVYHRARGNTLWTEHPSTSEKETALVRGTDYLERAYARLWPGTPATLWQRLSFPRYDVANLASNEIPPWLKEAQFEAAYLELVDPGILSLDATEGGSLSSETEGLVTKSYTRGPSGARRFPQIHGILARHLASPAQVRIVRA